MNPGKFVLIIILILLTLIPTGLFSATEEICPQKLAQQKKANISLVTTDFQDRSSCSENKIKIAQESSIEKSHEAFIPNPCCFPPVLLYQYQINRTFNLNSLVINSNKHNNKNPIFIQTCSLLI